MACCGVVVWVVLLTPLRIVKLRVGVCCAVGIHYVLLLWARLNTDYIMTDLLTDCSGEAKEYKTYQECEDDFVSGVLHPSDLKPGTPPVAHV